MKKQFGSDEKEKINAAVLKQNSVALKRLTKIKQKRHVKEENEPVFDEILDTFNQKYATGVAAASAMEILKMVKNEF